MAAQPEAAPAPEPPAPEPPQAEAPAEAPAPEPPKDLERARKIADLETRLAQAEKAKEPAEILRRSGLLLAEVPQHPRALRSRREAAAAVLAQSDALLSQGRLTAAEEALEPLRATWSRHPGLADRLDRILDQQRYDSQMEGALATAERAGKAGRPLEGLQVLDRVHPNEHWTARFQQARERLQTQLTDSDREPPQITLTGPAEPVYKKGQVVTLPLRITDDLGVEGAEAYARPEGGAYRKITLRPLGGTGYEIQILPDLHQNKDIDLYVTATDRSGHTGTLGTAQRPFKIKRKKWFS